MNINSTKEILKKEFKQLNKFIEKNLHSKIKLITDVSKYLINNKGKQLRPLIVILTAKLFQNKPINTIPIKLACVIEYIHTATLLHDDVIDKSTLRRGKKTINTKWDNKTAILVGDFLYSRAFQIVLETKNTKILNVLANTTNKIAEGEILQLIQQNNYNTTEKDCLNIIKHKTAALFEASTTLGALSCKTIKKEHLKNIKKYGNHIGIAYQLLNDIIDYDLSFNKQEKKYNDFENGKLTIPILYTINNTTDKKKIYLKQLFKKNKLSNEEKTTIYKIIKHTQAIEYTKKIILKELKIANKYLYKTEIKNKYMEQLKKLTNTIDKH